MNKAEVKALTDDYILNGTSSHFDIGGNRIKGYIFTRGELTPLLGEDNSKHLFLMLGLSTDPNDNTTKFLNLIIAGVTKDKVAKTYSINELNFLISLLPIHIEDIVDPDLMNYFLQEKSIKLNNFYNDPDPYEYKDFLNGINSFANSANDDHLFISPGFKIKGYHLGDNLYKKGDVTYQQDLITLGLINPSASALPTDQFIFSPVIRTCNPGDTRVEKPYLSISVANLKNGKIDGTIIEYCLPCPKACPSNYPIQ